MNSANDDALLIEQIKQRDMQALAKYIDQNRDRLAGFVRSISGDHLLAVVEIDDLLQEVAATALTGLNTAPLQDYEPMQWLQQLARRRVADAARHFAAQRRDIKKQQSLHKADNATGGGLGMEQLLVASLTSASAAVSRDVRMMRLQAAIADLSEEQQTAIRLRYAEGMPTKQIAQKLGKTDVAIRVLLSRSMRHLEKQLEDVRPTR